MAGTVMSGNLEQFLTELSRGLDKTMVSVNKEMTLRTRIQRTWSMRQCARFLNVSVIYLQKFAKQSDDFPKGEYVGRERVFTIAEMMHMRALLAANAKRPYDYLAWRKPDDPLPVISFASQKGGTAKSPSAAHFAQYLSLHHGMRVGVMDADPQSTATLYFVGGEGLPAMPTEDTPSMVDFAGLFANEDAAYTDYSAEELDQFFFKLVVFDLVVHQLNNGFDFFAKVFARHSENRCIEHLGMRHKQVFGFLRIYVDPA